MRPDVFAQSLARAVEYRDLVREQLSEDAVLSLCGLGEPLLNRHTLDFTRQAVDAGFEVTLSTNASLLTEEKGAALLDAGLVANAVTPTALRFAPPLTVSDAEIDEAVTILDGALA